MKKLLFLAVIAMSIAVTPTAAHAQFGLGIVYDPTNYANAMLRYSQLVQQLNQLRATYNQVLNQYNLALQMSRNIPNMTTRYAATWSPWQMSRTSRLTRSHPRSLLSIPRLKRASSRTRSSICRRTRSAQMSLTLNGAFWPTILPLFHGSR